MSKCIDCGKYIRKRANRCLSCYTNSRPKSWVSRGYRFIHVDGKDIRVHRHIMEIHLGRKLLGGETVHHINGDKLDNRIENLQLMTNSEHMYIHHIGSKQRPRSDNSKQKMSISMKKVWLRRSKVVSQETRLKMSASMKIARARKFWNNHGSTSPPES